MTSLKTTHLYLSPKQIGRASVLTSRGKITARQSLALPKTTKLDWYVTSPLGRELYSLPHPLSIFPS